MKNIKKQLSICLSIGFIIFIISLFFFTGFDQSLEEYILELLIMQLYSLVIGMSNMFLFKVFNFMNFWTSNPKVKLIIGIVSSIVLTMICLLALNMFTSMVIFKNSWNSFIASQSGISYYFGLSISIVIVLAFHIVYFF